MKLNVFNVPVKYKVKDIYPPEKMEYTNLWLNKSGDNEDLPRHTSHTRLDINP
jgi:hypothetical protein